MAVSLNHWKDLFSHWPEGIPRRGVLITSFGEQIPFAGFMTAEAFLLAERPMPDSLGAGTIVLPYDELAGLKLTDALQAKTFRSFGFEGSLPKR